MELYLHNNHASSNVISMISLNAIVANAMENCKLGDAGLLNMIFLVAQA